MNNAVKKWTRILLPSFFIITWLLLAGFGGQYFGKLSGLASTDLSTFLPKSAESSQVNKQLDKFSSKRAIPAVIVYTNDDKNLSDNDLAKIQESSTKLSSVEGVNGKIAPPIVSDDGKAAITVVPISSDSEFKTVIPKFKQILDDASLPVTYSVTGAASFAKDLQGAFAGIDSKLLAVAVTVVFIILLIVYRSPFLPFIVLGSAMIALAAVVFVVYYLAKADIVQMNAQVQGILFILVIGTATDYSLLYIARYRNELNLHKTALRATISALKTSYSAIIAAGATVSAGLLCLLLSDLESNKALGPVGTIGITMSVLASLTLLPSLLLLFGRGAFWPKKPLYSPINTADDYTANHNVWIKIGNLVRRHPRRIWVGCTVVLIAGCLGIPQLRAEGVPQSSFVLGQSEAREGQKILDEHFPPGSGSPAYLITRKSAQDRVVQLLDSDKGVASVAISVSDKDITSVPVGKAERELRDTLTQNIQAERDKQIIDIETTIRQEMSGLPQSAIDAAYMAAIANIPPTETLVQQAYPFRNTAVTAVGSNVLLFVTLSDAADSLEARSTIQRLRDKVHAIDSSALVGGTTASQLDTNISSQHDVRLILPLILAAITIILMALLRAIIAPLVLLLTTILSFGATMGISALLFNHVWGFPGADPSVIIFGFVFLVALGIDYNIFLMTRVREETVKYGVSRGTIKGLVVTGGVITSAGIVLAATFASLGVIPLLFLVQIAFIVTFGVLLDTIIVRSLLVPALTLEIGRFIWWPSKLWRGKQ